MSKWSIQSVNACFETGTAYSDSIPFCDSARNTTRCGIISHVASPAARSAILQHLTTNSSTLHTTMSNVVHPSHTLKSAPPPPPLSLLRPTPSPPLVCMRVCSAVISGGESDEVKSSLQGLERDLGGVLGANSLSEPLFQLMCHGVPSKVKAAVDR